MRMIELTQSLHVRWDTNAYGSSQWLVLGAHGTLLLMQFVEMGGIALAFWFGNIEQKHFSDADDAAFYWYFMVAAWIPLYVMCFLFPRFS
jgi:cytochrome c oxidase subunit 3